MLTEVVVLGDLDSFLRLLEDLVGGSGVVFFLLLLRVSIGNWAGRGLVVAIYYLA